MFAKYAYQSYFQKFQRNNAQIGASFVIPLLVGSAAGGQYQEAATDMAKLRIQINQTRNRITADTRRSYQDLRKAEASRIWRGNNSTWRTKTSRYCWRATPKDACR